MDGWMNNTYEEGRIFRGQPRHSICKNVIITIAATHLERLYKEQYKENKIYAHVMQYQLDWGPKN